MSNFRISQATKSANASYLFYLNFRFNIFALKKSPLLAILSRYNLTINRANISRLNRRFRRDFYDMGSLIELYKNARYICMQL